MTGVRVICPNCLRNPSLKKDGTMRKHVTDAYAGRLPDGSINWCRASGLTAQQAIDRGYVARDWPYYRRSEP